jgi:hypothetical protein
MAEQGTGKHPHKSTEEPYPHHEGKSQESGHTQNAKSGDGQSREKEGGQSSDLKEREYRDAQGNVHHHTHTYEEQHGKK